MRLVNFGPGEIADRLTVLALKILYGRIADKPVDHFEQERNVLLVKFGPTIRLEQLLELAATNSLIWRREDELRRLREVGARVENQDEIIEIAFQLQELNDRRHELIATINKHTGDHVGAEKV